VFDNLFLHREQIAEPATVHDVSGELGIVSPRPKERPGTFSEPILDFVPANGEIVSDPGLELFEGFDGHDGFRVVAANRFPLRIGGRDFQGLYEIGRQPGPSLGQITDESDDRRALEWRFAQGVFESPMRPKGVKSANVFEIPIGTEMGISVRGNGPVIPFLEQANFRPRKKRAIIASVYGIGKSRFRTDRHERGTGSFDRFGIDESGVQCEDGVNAEFLENRTCVEKIVGPAVIECDKSGMTGGNRLPPVKKALHAVEIYERESAFPQVLELLTEYVAGNGGGTGFREYTMIGQDDCDRRHASESSGSGSNHCAQNTD
jgi:hypothetical protein